MNAGPDDRRQRQPVELREVGDDRRGGDLEPAALDGLLEELAVLGPRDRVHPGPDQLDPELGEDAGVVRARGRG